MEIIFVIGKILLGGYFIMSGVNHFMNLTSYTGYAQSKGVPMPKMAVTVTGLMLVLGGLGVVFSISTTFSLWLLVAFLVFVTPQMHAYWKIQDPMQKMGERVNFYKNLGLLGAILVIISLL